MTGDSKLYNNSGGEDDIPFAEALPLNDPRSGAGPKAYPVGLKNYHDDDIEANANVIKEATVLENLGWDRETRKIFIRKVYSILAFQLLLTFCVSAFMTLHAPTQVYVLTHGWPVMVSMVSSFILIFALMCYKDQEPINMYLLSAFTFAEAFLVGNVVTIYCNEGYQGIVLEAVFLTMSIFLGLTLFTFKSKLDFSFLGAFLSMGLGALILWGFLAMLFGVQTGYGKSALVCFVVWNQVINCIDRLIYFAFI